MKTRYFVVTCWKNGKLVSETRWDCDKTEAEYESNRAFECAVDRGIYDKVERTYVETEKYDIHSQHLNTGGW